MEVEPITVDPDEAQELQLALKNLEERRRQKRQKRIITDALLNVKRYLSTDFAP